MSVFCISALLRKLLDDVLAKLLCCDVADQHGEAATAAGSTEHVPDGDPQPLASSSGRSESEALSGPPQIGIIMGSDSDLKTMVAAEEVTHCSCTAASDAVAAHAWKQTRKELKTFGINSMRSQVLYRAAQSPCMGMHSLLTCILALDMCHLLCL